jgi:large subunit ribosomal protein L18
VPRLNVYRSLGHIYAQIIDDARGITVASASSMDKEVRRTLKTGGNVAAAKTVGKIVAQRATQAGVTRVVFDRGGYAYHGRVKALADAAREAGLQF